MKGKVIAHLVSGLRLENGRAQMYKRLVTPSTAIGSVESYELVRESESGPVVSTLAGTWPLSDERYTDDR
jgi:hypothetical protein